MVSKRFEIIKTDYGAELCDTGECILSSYEGTAMQPVCDLLNEQDELITKLYAIISELRQ